MKVILTGSKGFIGQNLLERLMKTFQVVEINEDVFEYSDWVERTLQTLSNEKPIAIFHVGACSNTLETDVNYMMKVNFEFTKLLMDWCKNNNSKMVFSSSAANYGTNKKFPSNLYGWSKYVAEQYVISNGGIALRYFNVYGPKEEHKGRMASVAYQFYIKHKNGEPCFLFPRKPRRDFVYIKDVVNANIHALNNFSELNGNWYEVGCGESKQFEDVLEILGISYSYLSEESIPNGYQFYTRSTKELWMKNWNPTYPLEVGLSEYKNYLDETVK